MNDGPEEAAKQSRAILFADVCDSTKLYDALGNSAARALVSECLTLMTRSVDRHLGSVIKTIGDELMCSFPTADDAADAAVEIQIAVDGLDPRRKKDRIVVLRVRIGFHVGPVIVEDGDLFGDAVNVAARMAGLAKAAQIVTSQAAVNEMAASNQAKTRFLDRLPVKGKLEDIDVCEVLWKRDDLTMMSSGVFEMTAIGGRLELDYRGDSFHCDAQTPLRVLGRRPPADIVVEDPKASREHARIECRRGRFHLIDVSTNGTWVEVEGRAHYLRRQELMLSGTGRISLGSSFDKTRETVEFRCT